MIDEMNELLSTAEKHDGFPAVSDQAQREVRSGQRELVTVGSAPLTAVGILGAGEVDLVVRPTSRNQGIGGTLISELLKKSDFDELRAWAHGTNPAAEHLLSSNGFHPIRTLLRLELAGDDLHNTADPALPTAVELTTYDAANPDHAAAIIEVNAQAFASHPDQGSLTVEAFLKTTSEKWFDPKDLILAFDTLDSRLLAFSWIKTTHTTPEDIETELYVIGVRPDQSGKGLGTAMLNATMQRMATHHPKRVTLYVEGDNLPALALYHRAGFHTAQQSRQWLLTQNS